MRWYIHFLWSLFAIAAAIFVSSTSLANAKSIPLSGEDAFRLTATNNGGTVSLKWTIEPGYYLYRDFLTATDQTGQVIELKTPDGTVKDDPNFGATEIYYNKLELAVTSQEPFKVTYQGCQDGGLCYPPMTKVIEPATLAASIPSTAPISTVDAPQSIISTADSSTLSPVETYLESGGLPLLMAGFLGLGLLLAFTPCVFPMYPILLGSIAKRGAKLSAKQGLILSGSYVLSMAAAFSLFGVAAAWWGQSFQQMIQSQGATYVIVALFVVLALASFGLFHFQIPSFITTRITNVHSTGGSIRSSALLGFGSALIIGPCVTAPLAGALLYIARTGDIIIGALALFALGIGKGIPLVLLATFGSKLLPKAGRWMEQVNILFGLLFLASAIYLSSTITTPTVQLIAWGAFVILTAIFLQNFLSRASSSYVTDSLTKAVIVIAILYGSVLIVGGTHGGSDPLNPLAQFTSSSRLRTTPLAAKESLFRNVDTTQALNTLLADSDVDRPNLVYFTADWCVTCKAIERNILNDSGVANAISGMNAITFDLTAMTPEKSALLQSLNVFGPPTMLFLDGNAKEVDQTRLVGDVTRKDLFRSFKLISEAMR